MPAASERCAAMRPELLPWCKSSRALDGWRGVARVAGWVETRDGWVGGSLKTRFWCGSTLNQELDRKFSPCFHLLCFLPGNPFWALIFYPRSRNQPSFLWVDCFALGGGVGRFLEGFGHFWCVLFGGGRGGAVWGKAPILGQWKPSFWVTPMGGHHISVFQKGCQH